MEQQICLCHQKLVKNLERADCVLRLTLRDQANYLYNHPHRKPQWENKKIHKKQALLPQ